MKNIAFPDHWENPKYYPEGSRASLKYGSEWRYSLMRHGGDDAEDITYFTESEIKPLTAEELRQTIQTEIDLCQSKVAALTAQLREVEQG